MNGHATVTAERLRQEYSEIGELEAQLLKVFAERCQPPARITGLFRSLYERVTAHLEDEESGCIHNAAEKDRELACECFELCEEHETLQSQLDSLMELTRGAESDSRVVGNGRR